MTASKSASSPKASPMTAVNVTILILALLGSWVFAIVTWGYPAIILPALALTFIGMVTLVFVTRG